MGGFKTISRLLCACAFCAVALWILDRAAPAGRAARNGRLLSGALRDVEYLLLERGDGRLIELQQSGGKWEMRRPNSAKALEGTVHKVLDELERAPILERIDADDIALRELTYADFGFSSPSGRIVIRTPRRRDEIVCGDYDSTTNGLFVKFMYGEDVYVTSPALRSVFSLAARDFADTRLVDTDMRLVNTVILRRPSMGDVKLVRSGRKSWTITQPFEAPADWDAVAAFFDMVASASIVNFGDGATMPFDQTGAASIRLFRQNNFAGSTINVGEHVPGNADLVYAQGNDGAAIVVTGALRRAAMMTAYDFRTKRVFDTGKPGPLKSLTVETPDFSVSLRRSQGGSWAIAAPVSAPAEPGEVAALVDSVLSLSAERLAPVSISDISNRIASVSTAYGPGRVDFTVFPARDDPSGRLAIVPADSDTAFLVPPSAISNILARCADPRNLVSRTVLDIDPDQVRSVTVRRAGAIAEAAERSAGKWTSAIHGRELDPPSLTRLFEAVRPLRAYAVAAVEQDICAVVEDGFEISFEFTDGATLRRTLVVGAPSADGTCAAGVLGSDTVFTLSAETAARLSRSLFLPEVGPDVAPAGEVPIQTQGI